MSSNNSVVGLQLSIPLYTGGMRGARGDEAVALAEKARFEVDATRKAVLLQTRGAWLGATGGLTRIQAYERAVESARPASTRPKSATRWARARRSTSSTRRPTSSARCGN